jgi:DNA-binding NarL/FixJ family response regulator
MIDSPLRLMLVDEDPVFRMGLRIWLEQTTGYRVVAEASQSEDALAILASRLGQGW